MQSGDEATQALRRQLNETQEEFDKFRAKAKQEYESMQKDLADKHKKELD